MSKRDFTFLDDFDLEGYWWLPNYPDEWRPGRLQYKSGEGMLLDVFDAPDATHDMSFGHEGGRGVVLGFTLDGRDCTLLKAHRKNVHIYVPGMRKYTIRPNELIVGGHYPSRDAVEMSSLQVAFTSLGEWLEHRPIRVEDSGGTKDFLDQKVFYERSDSFETWVPSLDATVSWTSTVSMSGVQSSAFEWRDTPFLVVRPRHPIGLDQSLTIVNTLQYLLTLLIGEPVYPTQVRGAPAKPPPRIAETPLDALSVFVVMRQRGSPHPRYAEDMLATLPTLGDTASHVLNAWFSMATDLKLVFSLFFDCIYRQASAGRAESDFLSLMQALEAYHRSRFPGVYAEPHKYEQWRAQIVAAIPEDAPHDLQDSIASRLRYGNEHALRKRMTDLFRTIPVSLLPLVTKEVGAFVEKAVQTRHYYTHLEKTLEQHAWKGNELLCPIAQLRALLAILLLREAAVDEKLIQERLPRTPLYRLFRQSFH